MLSLLRPVSTSFRHRLCAGAILALALAPGTFVRASLPDSADPTIEYLSIDVSFGAANIANMVREDVWEIASRNPDAGGLSALLVMPEASAFRAFSDRGTMLTFPMPGHQGPSRIARLGDRGNLEATLPDIESATRDPVSGDYWLGFESSNSVIRYSAADVREAQRRPPQWQDWTNNSGPEAMVRLVDGRFVVLAERGRRGVLHHGDPALSGAAMEFDFVLPGDFAPTDLAALPDGRVLVLMRRVSLTLPPFSAALGIFDPADITAGEKLRIGQLVNLDELIPRENYEGLAVEQDEDGAIIIWIVSDDNIASFQRTLLAKLRWRPDRP